MSEPERESEGELLEFARRVLHTEARALEEVANRLSHPFVELIRLARDCRGRVIVSGMGKSGHIARKIAATLASTGTPAVFLHPAEGFHGDLGVITAEDLLIAISNSGETEELVNLVPVAKQLGVKVVAITQSKESTLAKLADLTIETGKLTEADEFNLVPSTSTTVALALGDALALTLMHLKGFTPEDFATFHPRGQLGKKLTLTVGALLGPEPENPVVQESDDYLTALRTITKHKLGAVSVVDEQGKLVGIITDGDVRRLMERSKGSVEELLSTPVCEIMTKTPRFTRPDVLAWQALKQMEQNKPRPIFVLPVIDREHRPVGMLHIHHLIQAGFRTSKE